jgi:beta-N-acetylhexosaminidase
MTAQEWYARLSLEDRVAQLIVPRPRNLELSPTTYTDAFGAGGIIIHRDVYQNPAQMADYVAHAQHAALARSGVPLLICCDHEGGHVRFMRTVATAVPSNMALGAAADPDIAAQAATLLASELEAVGVNWTLAPVADVNNNPRNPVIGTRAFSDDPAVVGAYCAAAIRAYQAAGLLACAKHFPGHGDTDVDSHVGLPRMAHDRARLERIELEPFRQAIEAGVASVMTAHLLVEALDPEWIGTLSPLILTELLRNQLGHTGLVVTDALEMAGVADILPEPEAAIEAVRAGADALLTGRSPAENQAVFDALVSAVRSGRITAPRFERAVRNVLEAKARIPSDRYVPDPQRAAREVGAPAHLAQALEMARRTITVVRDGGHLPLPRDLGERLVVLSPLGSRRTMMETWTFGQSVLGREIQQRAPGAVDVPIEFPVTGEAQRAVNEAIRAAEVIVAGTLNAIVDPDQVAFIDWVRQQAPTARLVVVGMRTPYDLLVLPWLATYVAAYSSVEPSMVATTEVLFGEQRARGRLPVTLSSE